MSARARVYVCVRACVWCERAQEFTPRPIIFFYTQENEPYLLGIATAIAVAGNPPAWGAQGLYGYLACRFAHAALFLFDFPKEILPFQLAIRATPYLISVFTMFALAGSRFS